MRRWVLGPAALLGAAAGGILVKKVWLGKYSRQKKELEMARQERDLFYTWLLLEQKSVQLGEFFTAHGYKTAAVLGMNWQGRRLVDALRSSDVSVVCGVEIENLAAIHEDLTVCRFGDDPLPQADCMVICGGERISEKAAAVRKEFTGAVVSLPQVLGWLLEQHGIMPWDGAVKGWPPAGLTAVEKGGAR